MRYLNVKKNTIAVRFRSFRPLSGIKVSELQQEYDQVDETVFSSPHGD